MIDGGVASHPSLAGAAIEQNGFAGAPSPTGHGTAVASLLVGSQGFFRGAANGAKLYVADVYGGSKAAGSASAIVPALGWLASHRVRVINISLVGPKNAVVARAIDSVQRRGIRVVAAVGNDGPAAPPQYPASYPGVIAVTAVDARGHAIPEAGKATHLDFAAPGADMAVALPGRGYGRVRGTSCRAARDRTPARHRVPRAACHGSTARVGAHRSRHCLFRVPDRSKIGRSKMTGMKD
jgi:subtilisin family serine protease